MARVARVETARRAVMGRAMAAVEAAGVWLFLRSTPVEEARRGMLLFGTKNYYMSRQDKRS